MKCLDIKPGTRRHNVAGYMLTVVINWIMIIIIAVLFLFYWWIMNSRFQMSWQVF